MTITADTTYTADSGTITADGGISGNIISAEIIEPVGSVITADSSAYTADATWPTADGGIIEGARDFTDGLANANFIAAEISEPVSSVVTADSTAYSADATWPTADGGELTGARDFADAELIPATAVVGGGGYYQRRPQPFPIEGYGYGVLPELEGEAHGVVVIVGASVGVAANPDGEASGDAGVAGQSAGQVALHASAQGDRGEIGQADAVLKGLIIESAGAAAARGFGFGTIAKLQGIAIGRHDDDEAAVMTFLLAA